MKIRVGFTYDLIEGSHKQTDDPHDFNAEFDLENTINYIATDMEKSGFEVVKIGNFGKLLKKISLLKKEVDIVFNLAEGTKGRNREAEVPLLLERFGIPFIGSDALTMSLTLDKVLTKKILIGAGIPTPEYLNMPPGEPIQTIDRIKFPLIVKPRWEGSSKGINEKAKVNNQNELKTRVKFIHQQYKQPALIEEFISGQEFTVPIIGNNDPPEIVYLLQVSIDNEILLKDNFFTGNFVDDENRLKYIPANIPQSQKSKISALAIKTYRALECLDFSRIDFRVDDKGSIYVLEINCLPALAKSDAIGSMAGYLKMEYKDILNKIIEAGLKRYGLL